MYTYTNIHMNEYMHTPTYVQTYTFLLIHTHNKNIPTHIKNYTHKICTHKQTYIHINLLRLVYMHRHNTNRYINTHIQQYI